MSEDSNRTTLDRKQVDLTDRADVRCQSLGSKTDQLNAPANALDDSARKGREVLDEEFVLTPAERTELVSCLEKGANARRANVDHGANPYLSAPVMPHGPASREDRLNILRVDAWWDGWEEVPRGPEQVGLPFEQKPS